MSHLGDDRILEVVKICEERQRQLVQHICECLLPFTMSLLVWVLGTWRGFETAVRTKSHC
jgi:hypothetical protein